jgi:hypothetical protein
MELLVVLAEVVLVPGQAPAALGARGILLTCPHLKEMPEEREALVRQQGAQVAAGAQARQDKMRLQVLQAQQEMVAQEPPRRFLAHQLLMQAVAAVDAALLAQLAPQEQEVPAAAVMAQNRVLAVMGRLALLIWVAAVEDQAAQAAQAS